MRFLHGLGEPDLGGPGLAAEPGGDDAGPAPTRESARDRPSSRPRDGPSDGDGA